MIRVIRTKYLFPTDYKGARIKATDVRTGATLTESYDHSAHEPHELVADRLFTKVQPSTRAVSLGSVTDESIGFTIHVYQV
jgi:hypothetical protein